MCKEQGVIYFVFNSQSHYKEFRHSLKYLKRFNPYVSVSLITNMEIPRNENLDKIIKIESKENAFKLKAKSFSLSPYQRTLYLDSDTTIHGSVMPLLNYLNEFDFCIANEPDIIYRNRPPIFISHYKKNTFNTAVISYNSNKVTAELFQKWYKSIENEDEGRIKPGEFCDQYHFNKIIRGKIGNRLKFKIIDNRIYNSMQWAYYSLTAEEKENVIIKHWHDQQKTILQRKIEEYIIFILIKIGLMDPYQN